MTPFTNLNLEITIKEWTFIWGDCPNTQKCFYHTIPWLINIHSNFFIRFSSLVILFNGLPSGKTHFRNGNPRMFKHFALKVMVIKFESAPLTPPREGEDKITYGF